MRNSIAHLYREQTTSLIHLIVYTNWHSTARVHCARKKVDHLHARQHVLGTLPSVARMGAKAHVETKLTSVSRMRVSYTDKCTAHVIRTHTYHLH